MQITDDNARPNRPTDGVERDIHGKYIEDTRGIWVRKVAAKVPFPPSIELWIDGKCPASWNVDTTDALTAPFLLKFVGDAIYEAGKRAQREETANILRMLMGK